MERHSSFGSPRSCKWSSFRDRLRPRMSHSRSDSVHRFSWFLPTEGGSYLFSKSAHSPQRVKTGKSQSEHKFSDVPSTADIGVRSWRFSFVPEGDSCNAAESL